MLNIYEQRQQEFIQNQKELDVLADCCKWTDVHLKSSFNHGFDFLKTYPLVNTKGTKWVIHPNASKFEPLQSYYADIVKSYWVNLVCKYQTDPKIVSAKAIAIRHLVSILAHGQKLLCDISTADWQLFVDYCGKYSKPISQVLFGLEFIKIMTTEALIPANIKFTHPFTHAESLKGRLERNKNLMPTQETVIAIGNIFHQKMPNVDEPFNIITDQRENFALAMLGLSFAAPNRAAAEYFLLKTQAMRTKTIRDINGDTRNIFSLDWVGSKKFKDHHKHIWDQMSSTVERSLYFMKHAFDPARVLARFYEDPEQPLANLIKNTTIRVNRKISLKQKITLWQLGSLLGFYDSYSAVNQKHLNTIEGFPFNADESKQLSNHQLMSLFNFVIKTRCEESRIKELAKEIGPNHSLRSLQKTWIKYVKSKNPYFPNRVHGNGKTVRLSNAMVLMLGCQQLPGTFRFANTCFGITSANLRSCYDVALRKLFKENGYCESGYSIMPSQPRHYINTLCQEEGLGQELIAYFSGRAKVTHNIHYDHSDDDEKHFRAITLHGEKSRNINVIDAQEYTELTGRAAADMGVGLCTQDLYQNPCTYLSDFEANCVGCPSSAYCKGDTKALDLMQRDLAIQEQRLKSAPLQLDLTKNILSARWFKLHSHKVNVYRVLIELMKDKTILDGSIIRFTEQRDQFAVIDLHDKTLIIKTVQLPAPDAALDEKLLEQEAKAEEPTKLTKLLESFGL